MMKKRLDAKAWIRILEVFLAILIIMGAVLIIMNRKAPKTDTDEEIYKKQKQILEIISKNDSLRDKIIIGENSEVNYAISKMIPKSWNFSTNICELDLSCPNPADSSEFYEKNVYATEIVITSNLTYYSPKKLRFFVWMK